MAAIAFIGVDKHYPGGVHAVRELSLEVADGEFLVIVGPSGCGKSTVLRLAAGLESASAGEIRIGGRCVNAQPPRERNVAMVFQNYALYPHMSVRDNLAFPLKMQRLPKAAIERRVTETAALLGIESLLARRPAQLSGGERQRVAMGRALVREPAVFLMDEPLSNLDARLRVQMRAELAALARRLRTTTIYVTHDQIEAATLGRRVAVMRAGRLQQVADPRTLYERPANVFVAGFFGSPGMNVLHGRLQRAEGRSYVALGPARWPLPAARRDAPAVYKGSDLLVGVRPEHLRPVPAHEQAALGGEVVAAEALGHETIVRVRVPAAGVDTDAPPPYLPRGTHPQTVIAARLAPEMRPAAGSTLALAPDPARLYLFDTNGDALE